MKGLSLDRNICFDYAYFTAILDMITIEYKREKEEFDVNITNEEIN